MVAYHFPPLQGSSGAQRTLQFARHLPSFGWEPLVATIHPRAYPRVGTDLRTQVPPGLVVGRGWGLDSARHLALGGRYLSLTAVPDRWVTWLVGGVVECLRLVRRYRPRVLWSTFPVATAHLIGLAVHRLTGLPWVADFRDPMVPPGGLQPRWLPGVWRSIEQATVRRAARCVLVTPGALGRYRALYPERSSRLQVIENGYEEGVFAEAEKGLAVPAAGPGRPLRLVHSGILYAEGRDPGPFLRAVREWMDETGVALEITLRGPGSQVAFDALIASEGLGEVVKVGRSVPYLEAIREMLEADGVLIFQGAAFNGQIPAKAYECLRSRRPILALVAPEGDTAALLRQYSGVYEAPMGEVNGIKAALSRLGTDWAGGAGQPRDPRAFLTLSRRARTEVLARLLSEVEDGAART